MSRPGNCALLAQALRLRAAYMRRPVIATTRTVEIRRGRYLAADDFPSVIEVGGPKRRPRREMPTHGGVNGGMEVNNAGSNVWAILAEMLGPRRAQRAAMLIRTWLRLKNSGNIIPMTVIAVLNVHPSRSKDLREPDENQDLPVIRLRKVHRLLRKYLRLNRGGPRGAAIPAARL